MRDHLCVPGAHWIGRFYGCVSLSVWQMFFLVFVTFISEDTKYFKYNKNKHITGSGTMVVNKLLFLFIFLTDPV